VLSLAALRFARNLAAIIALFRYRSYYFGESLRAHMHGRSLILEFLVCVTQQLRVRGVLFEVKALGSIMAIGSLE